MKRFLFLVLSCCLTIFTFGQGKYRNVYGTNFEKEYKSTWSKYNSAVSMVNQNKEDTLWVKAVVVRDFYFLDEHFYRGDSVVLFGYAYVQNPSEYKQSKDFKHFYGFYYGKKQCRPMDQCVGTGFFNKKVFRALEDSKELQTTKSGVDHRYEVRAARIHLPAYQKKYEALKLKMVGDSLNKIALKEKVQEVKDKKTPLILSFLMWSISNSNSVSINIGCLSNTDKVIKYVDVDCEFYDEVGGHCYDYITNEKTLKYRMVGYVKPANTLTISMMNTNGDGKSYIDKTKAAMFSLMTSDVYSFNTKTARILKILGITITFGNGDKYTLTDDELKNAQENYDGKYHSFVGYVNNSLLYKKH